jgi:hypothetical protein
VSLGREEVGKNFRFWEKPETSKAIRYMSEKKFLLEGIAH